MSRVIVIGGGIAGQLAAAYFRSKLPEAEVVIVDPARRKRPIVGESTVEISTRFIRGVGLGDHLIREQLPKYALTYDYKVRTNGAALARPKYLVSEAPYIPPYPSYQLNRGTFDQALRSRCEELGVRFINGQV